MKKSERLHHRSLVEGLFRHGKSFYEYPLRVIWRQMTPEQLSGNFRNQIPEGIGKLQMMVGVPKKKRKRAVDRVLLRRRLREAYRLNNSELKEIVGENSNIGTLSVAFIYQHKENMPYSVIEEKMINALGKLGRSLANDN